MVVGLTGRYCSGKDTVARALAARGYRIIDADAIAHDVLAEQARTVISVFGQRVQAPGGGVDRRALGRIVFTDAAARERLEAIIHPPVVQKIRQQLAEAPGDAVINAPLLHKAGLHALCDAVLFVRAPALIRLVRAMRRDSLSLRDAIARLSSQGDVRPQRRPERRAHGRPHGRPQLNGPVVDTYSVPNWGSARALQRRIARLDRRLRG